MGVLGNAVLGAAAAVFLTTDPVLAFSAGISAGFLLENLVEKAAPGLITTKVAG